MKTGKIQFEVTEINENDLEISGFINNVRLDNVVKVFGSIIGNNIAKLTSEGLNSAECEEIMHEATKDFVVTMTKSFFRSGKDKKVIQ